MISYLCAVCVRSVFVIVVISVRVEEILHSGERTQESQFLGTRHFQRLIPSVSSSVLMPSNDCNCNLCIQCFSPRQLDACASLRVHVGKAIYCTLSLAPIAPPRLDHPKSFGLDLNRLVLLMLCLPIYVSVIPRAQGWVSLKLKDKALLAETEKECNFHEHDAR